MSRDTVPLILAVDNDATKAHKFYSRTILIHHFFDNEAVILAGWQRKDIMIVLTKCYQRQTGRLHLPRFG